MSILVLELKYKRPSRLQQTEVVFLEPEVSQSQFFFQAEIADSQLIAELFYRLHRVAAIRTGRIPISDNVVGSGSRARRGWRSRWWYYDPIITVQNDFVEFETFSLDMGTYAKIYFREDAFKNVEHWEVGVTNVDFSKEFISRIRNAKGSLRNMLIDPEGLEIQSDTESMLEKKIPLPESWEVGLEKIRTGLKDYKSDFDVKDSNHQNIINRTPFSQTFMRSFTRERKVWQHDKGWNVIELALRRKQGHLTIATTPTAQDRFDGRKNINFEVVKNAKGLRGVKSYFLRVEALDATHYRIVGDTIPHFVTHERGKWTCDCPDYWQRGVNNCKHIHAVKLPNLMVIGVSENEWAVIDNKREYAVRLRQNEYICECNEFKKYNLCHHIASVQRKQEDYQFKEIKQDFTPLGSNIDENLTVTDIEINMGLEKAIRQIAKTIFSKATHVKLGKKKFPILTKVGQKN